MTDMSIFSAPQAALLAQCHRRTVLTGATEAVRDALNADRAFTAGPAQLSGAPNAPAAAFILVHEGARYRITLEQTTVETRQPAIEPDEPDPQGETA